MLLVIAYSHEARTALRNVSRAHEETIVRRFGRAALFEATEFGAFLALRLQGRFPADIQIERTQPLNEFEEVPAAVRDAAKQYVTREEPHVPYAKFAASRELPDPDVMRDAQL